MSTDHITTAPAYRRWLRRSNLPLIGLMMIVVVALNVVGSSNTVFILNSVLLACIGALALQMLQGTAGLISTGNAAFLMTGAFGTTFMQRAGLAFPLDIIAAVLLTGVAGALVALPALRLRGLYLVLATLAAHFIVTFVCNFYQGEVPEARNSGFLTEMLFIDAGDRGGFYWSLLLVGVVSVVILVAGRVMTERSGRVLRFMRDHEHVAPTLGIPVVRYKILLFVITSMIVGVQGGLITYFNGSVQTSSFTLMLAFQYVVMILIGGSDSIPGAIVGAAVVVSLPLVVPNLVGSVFQDSISVTDAANVSLIIYGLLVVYFVTSSTNGIVGLVSSVVRRVIRNG